MQVEDRNKRERVARKCKYLLKQANELDYTADIELIRFKELYSA
jgi:hypothetical protein